jgi:hypothetical protein
LAASLKNNWVGLNLNIKSRNMLLVLNLSGVLTRPFHEHLRDRHRVSADLLVGANPAERIKISHRNIDVFLKYSYDEHGTLRTELRGFTKNVVISIRKFYFPIRNPIRKFYFWVCY